MKYAISKFCASLNLQVTSATGETTKDAFGDDGTKALHAPARSTTADTNFMVKELISEKYVKP